MITGIEEKINRVKKKNVEYQTRFKIYQENKQKRKK